MDAEPESRTEAQEQADDERPYAPIACAVHDRLEAAATTGALCRIRFRGPEGDEHETLARLLDVYAQGGAEYVALSTGERVRLDRLVGFEAQG